MSHNVHLKVQYILLIFWMLFSKVDVYSNSNTAVSKKKKKKSLPLANRKHVLDHDIILEYFKLHMLDMYSYI